MKLTGSVHKVQTLTRDDQAIMFGLMCKFYDHMHAGVFEKDLRAKDFCLLLRDEDGAIQGFSTQKILTLDVGGRKVSGFFSGDTIIHKDYWGSPELFKVCMSYFMEYGKRYDAFYWFLTSKGYKTYKIMAKFFLTFYPSFRQATPPHEKSVMDAYAALLYPGEYDPATGVIQYKSVKDALKKGVADITSSTLRDKDTAFFAKVNPGYLHGDDLVCLTRMSESNLTAFAKKRLIGK